MKIGKELCGVDTYLGTIYYSPTGNKESVKRAFELLSGEILSFQKKGRIILQGDLNAHVGTREDTIVPDKFDLGVEEGEIATLPPRNSEDRSLINARGEELIELCKSHNLVILNGRKTGVMG